MRYTRNKGNSKSDWQKQSYQLELSCLYQHSLDFEAYIWHKSETLRDAQAYLSFAIRICLSWSELTTYCTNKTIAL